MPEHSSDAQPAPAFTEFFNALINGRGLSGAQAARRLRVAQSQVSRWKRGEGGISLANLERIHEEFGVDLDYLKQIAGLRNSNPSTTIASIEAERQLWRARYDDLIEKKVPRWAREAYIAACEALADAYTHMRPGELSNPVDEPLTKQRGENNSGETEGDSGNLAAPYRRHRSTYRFVSASPVNA